MCFNKKQYTLPVKPRFTLDGLREIRIAAGDSESTIACYVFIHNRRKVEKYAAFDDLTRAEQAAALAFILKNGETVIKRKLPVRDCPPIDLEKIDLSEYFPEGAAGDLPGDPGQEAGGAADVAGDPGESPEALPPG